MLVSQWSLKKLEKKHVKLRMMKFTQLQCKQIFVQPTICYRVAEIQGRTTDQTANGAPAPILAPPLLPFINPLFLRAQNVFNDMSASWNQAPLTTACPVRPCIAFSNPSVHVIRRSSGWTCSCGSGGRTRASCTRTDRPASTCRRRWRRSTSGFLTSSSPMLESPPSPKL